MIQYLLIQRFLTSIAYRLSKCRLPWLKNYLITYFIKRHHIHWEDFQTEDPYQFACFDDLFTRHIKPQKRPIDKKTLICSPCDGFILNTGKTAQGSLLQVKGNPYSMTQLLNCKTLPDWCYHAYYTTLYLAPHHYHRYHSPMDMKLLTAHYIPGKLHSVNPQYLKKVPEVFSTNERLIIYAETSAGPLIYIIVGACLVSGIETPWTGIIRQVGIEKTFNIQKKISKGDSMGTFHFGSTIILLTQFPSNCLHKPGTEVRMGQALADTAKAPMTENEGTP